MTEDLLAIPGFLKRKDPGKPVRRTRNRDKTWSQGVPVKRPTRGQTKILVKRGWAYQQIVKLSRDEAAVIIRLGVDPEARFTKDKKHQFPDAKEDDEK